MKKLFFCLLLIGGMLQAQTAKLSALSTADFLSSRIIYEDNGSDVYGYFLLYEKDKMSKGVYELEYVLLDKNLNKLASGSFVQDRVTSMFVDFKTKLAYVQKQGDKLYFSLADVIEGYEYITDMLGLYSLRSLNLKDYTVSESHYMRNFKPVTAQISQIKRSEIEEFQYMKPTKNNGLVVFDESMMDVSKRMFMGKRNAKNIRRMRFFDLDMNEKWSYDYNETADKSYYEYWYWDGDGQDMMFTKEFYDRAGDRHTDISYDFFDAQTGKKKFTIALNDAQNLLRLRETVFEKDRVIFYAATNDFNKKDDFSLDKITGYAKITIDRNTGKELDRHYFKWNQLAGKLDIDNYGKIKSYGYIHFMDYKRTADQKTIVIGEGFSPKGNSQILDLFAFVFDENMNLVDYKQVDKMKNNWVISAYGPFLEDQGAFDYLYSQQLPGGGYAFFYADNEKKSAKKPSWVLGILTYADGKFDTQKVTLTTKEGQIYPFKAKNGYILLREENDKDSELRLEKINY